MEASKFDGSNDYAGKGDFPTGKKSLCCWFSKGYGSYTFHIERLKTKPNKWYHFFFYWDHVIITKPETRFFNGSISEVWFHNEYIDFSKEENRRKFMWDQRDPYWLLESILFFVVLIGGFLWLTQF